MENKNNTFKLGRSIAQIIPFHRIPILVKKPKEFITTKMVILMVAIAILKIAVLLLWPI
jgi:hypothetical protein